jgi:dTDP-4-amino-4,6-dideoxygalactose transaminase
MDKLAEICKKHGLYLVEDAAQAHLAEFDGKAVGSIGDVGAFSFYPTKNMTTGEGGMATTGNKETERRIRLLRNQGMEIRYQNEIPGFNNRMTEVAAAIGIVQLKKIEKWTLRRQANAAFLDANLKGVVVPPVSPKAKHVYHQYTIRLIDQDRTNSRLNSRGWGWTRMSTIQPRFTLSRPTIFPWTALWRIRFPSHAYRYRFIKIFQNQSCTRLWKL